MRILCCLDGTNSTQLSHAIFALVNTSPAPGGSAPLTSSATTIGLLYVIDTGPHTEMERQRLRFLRSSEPASPRREQIHQAELVAAREILEEGQQAFPGAETEQRTGRPEREIVSYATAWQADMIVIGSHTPADTHILPGPRSVGHVAHFVLDHAPCPVLLLRPRMQG